MVNHAIFFKLKENTPEMRKKTVDLLLSMKGKVEAIIDLKVGTDFLGSERSYDIFMEVTVADKESLPLYAEHPYHVEVIKAHMKNAASSSVTVDYEF